MSQRYGQTYASKSGGKTMQKPSQGSLNAKTTDTDNEEWESEVDKMLQNPPEWTRKRSYITRLQKQNKRRFQKATSNSKCNKKYNIPSRAYTEKKHGIMTISEKVKRLAEGPTPKNTYCIWTKAEKFKVDDCPSTSKISALSKVSLEKKSIADWKQVRRKHIMTKFDRFAKGILKMTGKLSSETVDMITVKLKENLERKDEVFDKRGTRECSKKKTVNFIKKILKETSAKHPTHHRNKPQKKYNLVRQSLSSCVKAKSAILPKLLHLKSGGSKNCMMTRSMQTSTRTLYRSQSELLVKSTMNIKVIRSFSETSTDILTKPVQYSTLNLTTKDASKINLDNRIRTREDIREPILLSSLGNFQQASSKKIINLGNHISFIDCLERDVSDNDSSTSTVESVKLRRIYDSYRRPNN